MLNRNSLQEVNNLKDYHHLKVNKTGSKAIFLTKENEEIAYNIFFK